MVSSGRALQVRRIYVFKMVLKNKFLYAIENVLVIQGKGFMVRLENVLKRKKIVYFSTLG